MIKTILIVLAVVIACILIYAATKPDTFRVQRSITIKATPETIFPLISDLHNMQTWSAWEKVDPGMKRTYSGAASGPGAVYEWDGNQDIGQGRMEIIDAMPPAKITIRMDFIKPFPAQNTLEFVLQTEGDSTRVTQAIFGPSPYLSKVMSLVFSMDKMIGGKFEESLAELKTITEK
ncbi:MULTISPECIES: SRPBCC family protein [Methylomonas]|uniref:Polyketide cyclase n=2 Tax=Methylomonas TaxID=416 RepID=A0A126T4G3_9GAMM|nr:MULTISPECIES: SRPBCC family protein [Methylomonas]AMK76975.1 polyketide cyclase [Methylomonas denitrificans]OAH98003.1 polyketide cyclase [Methylomonas methanica]TCV81154.1 polyketide cyclase/dehydrase/lipid transport protein [Methylomonas methanica]